MFLNFDFLIKFCWKCKVKQNKQKKSQSVIIITTCLI